MLHHHLHNQHFMESNKLYSSFINRSNNCKKKYFPKYDVINDDVITVFALICAVREELDIILSITPAQTWGRFCDYLLSYGVITSKPL